MSTPLQNLVKAHTATQNTTPVRGLYSDMVFWVAGSTVKHLD